MRRHPEVVWLVAAGVVVLVVIAGISAVSGAFRDDRSLSATSPEQLVNEVRSEHVGGYSGTISTNLNGLALPRSLTRALAVAVPVGGTLLRGKHTLRYWYGDGRHQRTAVVGRAGEQDVFRNGDSVLVWDTYTSRAARTTTRALDASPLPLALATPSALAPPELADRLLDMAGSAAEISLRSGPPSAGRPTYELVVRPNSAYSLIDEMRIQVDGTQVVPLGVEVYVRGLADAAISTQFTNVSFATPAERNFSFVAPTTPRPDVPTSAAVFAADPPDVTRIGDGWLAVSSYRSPAVQAAPLVATRVLGPSAQKVKGRWGTGRILDTRLLCVLVTSSGRVLAGPVEPARLYQVLD